MKLAGIAAGDLVLVSKGGRRFHGQVVAFAGGVVEFEPLQRGVSYRHAGAHEVIDHWRHTRRRGDGVVPLEQLSLTGRGRP